MIEPQYNKKEIKKEDLEFEIRKIYRHYKGRLYILIGFCKMDSPAGGEVVGDVEEHVIISDVLTGDVLIRLKDKFFDRHPQTNQLRYTPIDIINTREVQ